MSDNATKYVAHILRVKRVGTNLVGRSTGMVVNPNMTVLFSGPTLRSFQFSFPMTPRSADEAIVIRKIVRAFKRNSLPQRSGSTAFLMTPRVFLLKYIFKSNSTTQATHPFLNKFKPFTFSNFNVSNTPDNSYMKFKDGSMTRYTIDLTFKEVVPSCKMNIIKLTNQTWDSKHGKSILEIYQILITLIEQRMVRVYLTILE